MVNSLKGLLFTYFYLQIKLFERFMTLTYRERGET